MLKRVVAAWVCSMLLMGAGVVQSADKTEQHYFEQAEFQMAKSEGTIKALERFIAMYPSSSWREKAVYERDRLAYNKAAQKGTVYAVRRFIDSYPDSSWLPNAHVMLNRLKKDESNRNGRFEDDVSNEPLKKVLLEDEPAKATAKKPKPSRYQAPDSNELDRVSRALAIYGERNAEKQKSKEAELKRKKASQKKKRQCNELKDTIEQYNQRINWYVLDEKGERKFLSDAEVKQSQKELSDRYKKNCS